MTGRFQRAAMFMTSYIRPCAVAPSPKKQTVTSSLPSNFAVKADPVAIPMDPPTMALAPRLPLDGSALTAAIAFFLAQKLAKHLLEVRPLGDAVAVTTVGRGDLVGHLQRLANAHGHGFFAGIHMGQARHLGGQIQLVGVVLERADANHLAIHPQVVFGVCFCLGHDVLLGDDGVVCALRREKTQDGSLSPVSSGWRSGVLLPGTD